MNIYIINLPAQTARAAFQEKQFSRLGLDYLRVDAVSIADVSNEYYERVAFDWERPLSRAEVSCYHSHKSLWQRVLDEDEPALILEDDAYLCDDLPQLLNEIATLRASYINLETRCRKKIVSEKVEREFYGYQLRQLYYGGTGAAAYILWPEGAQRLLAMERRSGVALVDAQICRTRMGSAWQIDSAAAIQLDCCDHYQMESPHKTESTLADTRYEEEKTTSPKAGFKWRRLLLAQFMLGLIQLRVFFGGVARLEIMPNRSRFGVSQTVFAKNI